MDVECKQFVECQNKYIWCEVCANNKFAHLTDWFEEYETTEEIYDGNGYGK